MKLDKYDKVKGLIRTGDLIAFSGKGWQSGLIKNATSSKYSHVGAAVWITPSLTMEPRLFIAESTTLNTAPDVMGEYRKGVQIVAMAQRLEGYDGEAWWFPLKNPLTEDEKIAFLDWIWKAYSSKTKYDTAQAIAAGLDPEQAKGWLKWILAPLGKLTSNREDLKRLFCSEMYAKSMQVVNRVPPSINPSEMTPEDVVDFPIYLVPPVSLCEEVCEN